MRGAKGEKVMFDEQGGDGKSGVRVNGGDEKSGGQVIKQTNDYSYLQV